MKRYLIKKIGKRSYVSAPGAGKGHTTSRDKARRYVSREQAERCATDKQEVVEWDGLGGKDA